MPNAQVIIVPIQCPIPTSNSEMPITSKGGWRIAILTSAITVCLSYCGSFLISNSVPIHFLSGVSKPISRPVTSAFPSGARRSVSPSPISIAIVWGIFLQISASVYIPIPSGAYQGGPARRNRTCRSGPQGISSGVPLEFMWY